MLGKTEVEKTVLVVFVDFTTQSFLLLVDR